MKRFIKYLLVSMCLGSWASAMENGNPIEQQAPQLTLTDLVEAIEFSGALALKERVNKYTCPICSRIITKAMARHIRIHSAEYQCGKCGLSFQHKSHLDQHTRKHINGARYTRKLIDKSFQNKKKHEK